WSDMKASRRRFLLLAQAAVASPFVVRGAWAETYPARPVRIVAPFPPGGSIDITARIIAQWLSDHMGQQFVVENRPGAGGNIGSEVIATAPPDGYSLLLCSVANSISVTLYEKLGYDFVRDLAPVAAISRAPNVMAINPAIPANSVAEFITYAKNNPGK